LKIPEENIFTLKDGNWDEVEQLWDDLKKLYQAASRIGGPKTLFLIWYGGHGEMDASATTQISVNDPDEDKRCYPWEQKLMALASRKNTYTLAFFDCCRTMLNHKSRGGPSL
jgi:hypothetical protein